MYFVKTIKNILYSKNCVLKKAFIFIYLFIFACSMLMCPSRRTRRKFWRGARLGSEISANWTQIPERGRGGGHAMYAHNTSNSHQTKGGRINKTSPDIRGWTKSTRTTQHNTASQWERSSNSPSLAHVVAELRWYEKKIQHQWGGGRGGGTEEDRGRVERKKKSWNKAVRA